MKVNKLTQRYLDKIVKNEVPEVFINSEDRIEITDVLKNKIKNVMSDKTNLFESTPYLKKEGLFDVTLLDMRQLKSSDGVMFLIEYDNTVYRVGIFYNGFSCSSTTQIENLLSLLQPGDVITIRLGKNFRGTRYYIRYIKCKESEIGILNENGDGFLD